MHIIFCETEKSPTNPNAFDLIRQIEEVDFGKTPYEEITEWTTADRLQAAIINVGLACKYFVDNNIKRGYVDLKSDTDGNDHRYDNEHNILYNLLCPSDGHEAIKHAKLYAEYLKYLDRINTLRCEWRITVDLKDDKRGF